MRSGSGADLTGKARIRDAALTLFARHGHAGTSVRAIAAEAGVSATLVIHHFGSKEGLRRACEEHVLDAVFAPKDDLAAADPGAVIGVWLRDIAAYRPLLDYLARMLSDGTQASAELFAALVARTEMMLHDGVEAGTIREHGDMRMLAALLAAQGVVPLILQRQLGASLPGDPGLEDVIRRMTVPLLELYSHGLYTDASILDAARAASAQDGAPQDPQDAPQRDRTA